MRSESERRWLARADGRSVGEPAPAPSKDVRGEARGDADGAGLVAYDELVRGGEPAVWRWLSALHETGATLLTGVPCAPEKVTEVARLVGPVQPQIYGEAWDVVAQEGAINIAYTGEPLAAHMDLCYYESPPGLQLLHCLAFDDGIVGGDS